MLTNNMGGEVREVLSMILKRGVKVIDMDHRHRRIQEGGTQGVTIPIP